MKVAIKRILQADTAELEQKINTYLHDPANAGSSVAAVFESDNGDVIVVFQRL